MSFADNFVKQFTDELPIGQIIEPVSLGLELVGVVIIVYGAIVSLIFLVREEARGVKQAGYNQHTIKRQFTSRILTGLEFFIAGDVLKTIVNPTLESLAIVGVIVAIRAALTFLLNRELKDEEKLRSSHMQQNKGDQSIIEERYDERNSKSSAADAT